MNRSERKWIESNPQKALQSTVDQFMCSSRLNQCSQAFYKLPVVTKHIEQGPNGGMFYYNARGVKVYLKPRQEAKWRNGTLPGATNRPPRG
jgi:hypothetical protein